MAICEQIVLDTERCWTAAEPQVPAGQDAPRATSAWEVEIVCRIQHGDQGAFRELVERYQARVFSTIYGILRNRNEADDIAQEVFAKAYFGLRHFEFRSSLGTWIQRIAVNECYGYLRKGRSKKRDSEVVSLEGIEAVAEASAEKCSVARDLANKLLMNIPEQERWLLILKEVEGRSVAELARMTGVNENTMKVRLYRARQKLIEAAGRLSRAQRTSRPE